MRKFYITNAVILFCVLLCSCGERLIPAMLVDDISINDTYIQLVFSSEPSRNSLINTFSCLQDGNNMNGEFYFNGTVMQFFPLEEITADHDYMVMISTDAEDIYGFSIKEKYVYKFTTKSEKVLPIIVSVTPSNESVLQQCVQNIDIVFSEQVDKNSFERAFSIKPSVACRFVWNDAIPSVSVCFDKPLALSTVYTMTISTELTDLTDNALANKYTSIFTNAADSEYPTYCVYAICDDEKKLLAPLEKNVGIELKSSLLLEFSESMDITSISSRISVKPDLSFSVEFDKQSKQSAQILFTSIPKWGDTEYLLTIYPGLKDLSGNEVSEPAEYRLVFDNEKDRPVSFIKGIAKLENNYFSISEKTNYGDIPIYPEIFPTVGGTEVPISIYYIFQISQEATGLDFFSALSSFSVTSTNSCLSIILTSVRLLSQIDICGANFVSDVSAYSEIEQAIADGSKLCGVLLSATLENADPHGEIRFNIEKGLSDDIGNSLPESIVITYNEE